MITQQHFFIVKCHPAVYNKMWGINSYMLMSLPSLSFRATSQLRSGSLIEYTRFTDSLGLKTSRALAIVVRVDWTPKNARSRVYAMVEGGHTETISISHVTKILVL